MNINFYSGYDVNIKLTYRWTMHLYFRVYWTVVFVKIASSFWLFCSLQFLTIYRINLNAYFDDDLVKLYGGNAEKTKSKVRKVMTYVGEIYEERDTLQPKMKMNINTEHKQGHTWGLKLA